MTPELTAALTAVAAAAASLRDEWWVFGSAAMRLAGVAGLDPPDVDLLASERDAHQLVRRWGAECTTGSGTERFRSTVFAKTRGTGLPIEIMAGLEVSTAGGWVPVAPRTRVGVDLGGGRTIFIPSVAEQAEICRLFGRPKDIERSAALAALVTP